MVALWMECGYRYAPNIQAQCIDTAGSDHGTLF